MTEAASPVSPVSGAERTSLGQRIRDAVTDALRYWEPRRLVYNGVLTTIFLGYFVANWSYSSTVVSLDGTLGVFLLAVLANIAYCTAYLGDVFVQISGLRDVWHRWRWVLWLIGTVFAAIITRFFAMGFFTPPGVR
jgi:hypothetical protein